jgi:hypothetical protein
LRGIQQGLERLAGQAAGIAAIVEGGDDLSGAVGGKARLQFPNALAVEFEAGELGTSAGAGIYPRQPQAAWRASQSVVAVVSQGLVAEQFFDWGGSAGELAKPRMILRTEGFEGDAQAPAIDDVQNHAAVFVSA